MTSAKEVRGWHIAVLIPARDEEQLIGRCLRSVLRAGDLLPAGVTSDIVVLSDGSTDQTVRIAEALLATRGAVVQASYENVGMARACAANVALRRFQGPKHRCWLANTDADCEVPETWLQHQLELTLQGWAAVAGIIDVDSFEQHLPHVPARFRETYILHADGTHPHIHAAKLGVRADAYCTAGGWAGLCTAEDHDLWRRLKVGGVRQLSSTSLRVLTSGRRTGRAPLGFAGALAAHNEVEV